MEKTIKIGKHEYKMHSSAYTQFKYKNDTGRSLMDDIKEFTNKYSDMLKGNEEVFLTQINDIVETAFRLAYTMASEAGDPGATNFESFLKDIDDYYDNPSWLNEVVELATYPFRGGIQESQNNEQPAS